MKKQHFVIVCYPVQSHINPSLELANRLINLGHHVTLATTIAATRNIINNNNSTTTTTTYNPALCLATLSDGSDQEHPFEPPNNRTFAHYFSDLERYGSRSLTNLIINNQKPAFSCVIYTLLLNWAADVASSFNIQSALLFVQPATLLALYYYHFIADCPISNQQLPGLPLFDSNDIPSFFSPSSPHACLVPLFKHQLIQLLDARPSRVLVNTFKALEAEALTAIGHEVSMLSIGPLINGSSCGDGDCVEWLNSKAESSVVYVAFGSVCVLGKEQEEEIVHGLVQSGYTFLWVVIGEGQEKYENEELRKLVVELGKGKIVGWCCQIEVLSHASLGCFVTHCGWNSTIEGLALGVPMVGFPIQIDQPTNGKLVEDVWKSGVRVKANSEGIVERGEIRECLDLVMGRRDVGKREEIMKNAQKWKDLASQAVGEGGTSDLNLKAFVDEIGGNS